MTATMISDAQLVLSMVPEALTVNSMVPTGSNEAATKELMV